jgi:hypothetical protein
MRQARGGRSGCHHGIMCFDDAAVVRIAVVLKVAQVLSVVLTVTRGRALIQPSW